MLTIALVSFTISIKAQQWNPTGNNVTTGKVTAGEYSFPLTHYDFSKMPRTQISPMSIKLFDDYVSRRPGGTSPDNNSYGTLLAMYGYSSHWESNIYFGAVTNKMYFRTSKYRLHTAENGVQGDFNHWRTLLDSRSDVESTGLLKLEGNGNHYLSKGNFGIGTGTPNAKLDVNGSIIVKDGHNLSWGNKYGAGIPTIAANTASGIYFYPNGSTLGATMKIDKSGNVGIATTTIPTGYKLAIAGKIITEEVKVQLKANWPDYVFAKAYNLPTLKEVEKHIEEKGHLPNIPSAKEVKDNKGIELGKMNAKLLEKIEELTLYTIQQEKEIQELKKQKRVVKTVVKENKDLKKRLERLEKLVNKLL